MRRRVFLAALGAGTLSVLGCVSDEPTDAGSVREIHLTSSQFSPSTLTIAAGTRVRFVNDGAVFHTITPENANQAGVWTRRETTQRGTVFEHTFAVSGQTYRFRCEPHSSSFTSGMVGTITVT
ncbi:MAG TPA: plastocyanin/azurin family copper-binding protein [Longimicrobiales bacterium]|nr:plastocyanin/azurin family copper-binding protein [Longimicrobiales bacterium]